MNGVTVVIPALNEPYLPTLKIKLKEYNVDVRTEKGLTYAIWQGIQHSNSQIVIVMDADGSHPTEAIPNMIKLLNNKTWFVVGSRYCKGAYSHDSVLRKFFSLFYCALVRLTITNKIHDPMSNFWVGYRRVFKFKPSKSWRFGLQLLRKNHNHVVEYPIVFQKRKGGESHIKPLQAINDLFAIFKGV